MKITTLEALTGAVINTDHLVTSCRSARKPLGPGTQMEASWHTLTTQKLVAYREVSIWIPCLQVFAAAGKHSF